MGGPKLARMAWRNMWRNRRRTMITLTGIVFGVLLATLFTGLGDSTYTKMINLAARLTGGHISLQHRDVLDRGPSPKRSIGGATAKRKLALGLPEVTRAEVRITGHTMLAAGGNSRGAAFIAFDPRAEDTETLSVLEALKEGRAFESSHERGIILGRKLAEQLGVRLGRKVVYTMTDKHGEIVTGLARVRGIIKSGADSVDAGICLLPIDAVRKVLGYGPDEATQVAVFIKDQRQSGRVAARLGGRLGDAAAVTWYQRQPEIAGWIALMETAALFFELIVAILVAAGIFNTLFVSVMERLREFGIMMAIGFSPARLFRLVMWESLWVGLVGIVLAALATAYPYYYFNVKGIDMSAMVSKGGAEISGVAVDPVMRVAIYPEHAAFIAAAAVVATLLAGLYPAWRAGRVAPVESIKLV